VSSGPWGSLATAGISFNLYKWSLNLKNQKRNKARQTLYTANSRSCSLASSGGKNWKSCLNTPRSMNKQITTKRKHEHSNLLRCTREFRSLFKFRRASSQGIFKVIVHRIVRFALSFWKRKNIEVQSFPLEGSK
jgi:hypothetical protein